jgi:alpha-glucosidase (family GH31 glycosyl hydrolase)
MINLNMFGIPHSGADICGFYELDNNVNKFDEELCLRWIQLATFFPLARHSQAFTDEQAYLTGALGMKDTNNQRSA